MKLVIYLLFFFVYLLLNAVENFYREKWKFSTDNESAYWSRNWHHIQWLRWVYVLTIVLLLIEGISRITTVILPLATVWWILYDGILNLLRKRSFFYQSKFHNLSQLEKFATVKSKIILLIITLTLFLIINFW